MMADGPGDLLSVILLFLCIMGVWYSLVRLGLRLERQILSWRVAMLSLLLIAALLQFVPVIPLLSNNG